MMTEVTAALERLYPSRTWGVADDRAAAGPGAAAEAAALADELAGALDAAVLVRGGGPDELCDFLYVLCVGRPPCAIQVRDHGLAPPPEWRGARLDEAYLRVALSAVAPLAAIQEVTVEVTDHGDGFAIRERTRAGVYSPPLLRRMQRLVATLPAYGIVHVDMGDLAGPPPGFDPGTWPLAYAGTPAIANYLFFPQPATMTSLSWLTGAEGV